MKIGHDVESGDCYPVLKFDSYRSSRSWDIWLARFKNILQNGG